MRILNLFFVATTALISSGIAGAAVAETLPGAMAAAYRNNPSLNGARADLRAIDENVPQALSGYRPVVGAAATLGAAYSNSSGGSSGLGGGGGSQSSVPTSFSITVEQPLFRGFRTQNGVKQAEASVQAGREALRNTEQDILLAAVQAYMNVVRERAIVGLTAQNIDFLNAQVSAANDRLNVGEGTRTDVAQTQARQSLAVSDYNLALANLNTAIATFRQVIGQDPRNLSAAMEVRGLPSSVATAIETGLVRHPAIRASQYNVDVAAFNVKILEGETLPTLSVTGGLSYSDDLSNDNSWQESANVTGRLSVPIYNGGLTSSRVRQGKERLGQRRIEVDVSRDQVRALAVSSFGQLSAARAQLNAAQAQVSASQLALDGISEERRVGQRTTLDVLDAQQEVLNARVTLVRAQRDRVVASYSLLAAMGGLNAERLGLGVQSYQPVEHYQAVRDKWHGLRTPDGR